MGKPVKNEGIIALEPDIMAAVLENGNKDRSIFTLPKDAEFCGVEYNEQRGTFDLLYISNEFTKYDLKGTVRIYPRNHSWNE